MQIFDMRSRGHERDESQVELFKTELDRIVDVKHELVVLADEIDWDRFEDRFAGMWKETGRPGIDTRLMVSLHYLKYSFDLSDEGVISGWLQNPYWQYLSGMRYFQHEVPLDASSMTRWRKRVGESGLEMLLQESVEAGLRLKAIKQSELKRVNVDTTVAEKHVRYPTDSRLYQRCRERLVKEAQRLGIELRQNYNQVGKKLLLAQSRYAHARQFKRVRRCQKKLQTILGRVLRDIGRKASREQLQDATLVQLLKTAEKIHQQKRSDKNKVYSVHAPEVECISKGKVHKRYEFGVKVSLATTSKGGWHVGAMSLPGNPYDGHTLEKCLEQMQRINPAQVEHIFTDQGYRGHGVEEASFAIHVDKKRRGRTPQRLWRWMKRRAAIEPSIGHLKQEHRLNRNRLKGEEGDRQNPILSAAGMNFYKLLKHLQKLWLSIFEPFSNTKYLLLLQRRLKHLLLSSFNSHS